MSSIEVILCDFALIMLTFNRPELKKPSMKPRRRVRLEYPAVQSTL